nr:HNH endonuclease signature motif containing protein [Lampropedia aestuarii]
MRKPKGSSTERGYGSAWRRLREQILRRDLYLCQVCKREGRLTEATEVDHITNKSEGGTDEPKNLQAICTCCHKSKTAMEAARGRHGSR